MKRYVSRVSELEREKLEGGGGEEQSKIKHSWYFFSSACPLNKRCVGIQVGFWLALNKIPLRLNPHSFDPAFYSLFISLSELTFQPLLNFQRCDIASQSFDTISECEERKNDDSSKMVQVSDF